MNRASDLKSRPPQPQPSAATTPPRLLITAGPTHEPIDAVRYLANRSSGRLGIALADTAAARGWAVTLLLGPTPRTTTDSRVNVLRFQSTADLQALLSAHFPACDTLIMAAAVADYRPKPPGSSPPPIGRPPVPGGSSPPPPTKLRRTESPLTLELEPTPDLLAEVALRKRPGQTVIGFALEPSDRLLDSARSKLERKNLDAIVANPLETMDAPTIRATVLFQGGASLETPGEIEKTAFASWLLDALTARS